MKAPVVYFNWLIAAAIVLACGGVASSKIETAASEAVAFLPDSFGPVQATSPGVDRQIYDVFTRVLPDGQSAVTAAGREYRDAGGMPFWIQVVLTDSDSAAYA